MIFDDIVDLRRFEISIIRAPTFLYISFFSLNILEFNSEILDSYFSININYINWISN